MLREVFLTFLLLAPLERAATELCNVQLSYMQLLREEIKDTTFDSSMQLKLDNSSISEGKLLAASFDPVFLEGFSQINITSEATFKLAFKIDSGINHSKLQRADLLLFPEPLPSGVLLDLHLRVTVEAANVTRGAKKRPVYTWDSRESCIPLDVTTIMKKLFRYLQKKGEEKTLATITVSLTKIVTRAGVRPRVFNSGSTCKHLETAGCKQRPFLVLKYYTQRFYEVDAGEFGAFAANSGLNKHSSLVSSPTRLPGPSPVPSPTRLPGPSPVPSPTRPPGFNAPGVCTRRNLTVNLSQKLNHIVAPQIVNIGDCAGSCSVATQPHDNFSLHAILKQLLTPLSSCCVPTEMDSLYLILFHRGAYRLVSLEAVVKTCGCR